jgi:O-antigen/teichoic acid export membrane protein
VWFTARWMGAEVRGEISLFVASLYVLVLISGFFGGGTLIYLAPRFSTKALLFISYAWALLVSLVFVPALFLWPGLPEPQLIFWVVASLLFNLTSVNRYLMIGLKRIKEDNLLGIVVNLFQLLFLLFFVFWGNQYNLQAFVNAFILAWILIFLLSFWPIRESLKARTTIVPWGKVINSMFSLGFIAQITNLAQFIGYRVQYYLIDLQMNKQAVGVFSTAVSLTEAIWMISQSISLVQLSHIANLQDTSEAASLSLRWMKVSLVLSLLAILALLTLPSALYKQLFGLEFKDMYSIILRLSPGILMLAGSNILAHYFAGKGKLKDNLVASFITLVLVALSSYFLLASGGLNGAAWSSSIAYTGAAIWLVWRFQKSEKRPIQEWLPSVNDYKEIRTKLKTYVRN